MSRYTGPSNKKSRRVGFSTLENGKDLAKRPYKPGQHGQDRKAKASNYSIQLNEKQKVKFTYGLNEKQFRLLFNKAGKMQGIHGENFLRLLESRLDNIVYRMGLSRTRRGARQIVNHGHILVNGKKVDIPKKELKGDPNLIFEKSVISKISEIVAKEFKWSGEVKLDLNDAIKEEIRNIASYNWMQFQGN